MIRYYLVPIELQPGWDDEPGRTVPPPGWGYQPKYLAQIEARGGEIRLAIIGLELVPDGFGNKRFLRDKYLIRIVAPDGTDFTDLDNQSDSIHLTRAKLIANRIRLESWGIDTTGLTLSTPRKAIERRLIQWLTTEDKDISQSFGADETIG